MATLTRIQGSLYDATGTVVTHGKITMQLQQDIVSVDGTKVAPFTISVDLSTTGGSFDKNVYATVGASPSGVAYLVEYDPDPTDLTKPASQKDGYWRNYWAVPNTAMVALGNFVTAHRGEPLENYMPLGGSLVNPVLSDDVTIGLTPTSSNKRIFANQTAGANPVLRYNGSSAYWDLSNDGSTFGRIVTGTGTTGTLPKWSSNALVDSIISEASSVITINGTLKVPTISTAAATDLNLNPTGLIQTSKDLKPDAGNARSIGSQSNRYLSLYASELWVETLVAQNTMATIGGRILVAPTTSLTADLAAAATLGSFKHNQQTKGDIVYLQTNNQVEYIQIGSFDIVAVDTTSEWFEVSGDQTAIFTNGRAFTVRGSTGNNGTWTVSSAVYNNVPVRTRITVTGNVTNSTADGYVAYLDNGPFVYKLTRNLDGSGADQWYAGDAVLNTGTTGKGFIDIYSLSGVLSGTGPTIVGNVRTGTTYTNIEPRWAIGNLNGLYGYGVEIYGVAIGKPTGAWVKIDATNGVRIGYNTTVKTQIDASGNATFASGSLTITETGTVITGASGSSWASQNAYTFTTPAGAGDYGLGIYDDGITNIVLRSAYRGSGDHANIITLFASGDSADTHAAVVRVSSAGASSYSQITCSAQVLSLVNLSCNLDNADGSGSAQVTAGGTTYNGDVFEVNGNLLSGFTHTLLKVKSLGGAAGSNFYYCKMDTMFTVRGDGLVSWGGGSGIASSSAVALTAAVAVLNTSNAFTGTNGITTTQSGNNIYYKAENTGSTDGPTIQLKRSGGTASDWQFYIPASENSLEIYNGTAVGGVMKWDGNGDLIPLADNTKHVGVPSRRFAFMTALAFNTTDVALDNGWSLTEAERIGIDQPGVAIVDDNGHLIAFFGRDKTYLKDVADVDDLPYHITTFDQRIHMDRTPEIRIKGHQEDRTPIYKTKDDVPPMPDPAKALSHRTRKTLQR